MGKTEFLKEMADILMIDVTELPEDREVEPVYWDSLEIFMMIALIDQTGRTVDAAGIQQCHSVAEVLRLAGFHDVETCNKT
jgi:hypothetical protein